MIDNKNQPSERTSEQKQQAAQTTKEIIKYAKNDLSAEAQAELGKPIKDDTGVNPEDQQFLQMIISKIEKKEINLLVPSSLLNKPVYSSLSEVDQGKADYNAINLLSTIRRINNLWQLSDHESYQIQNLVHQVRVTKERLEELGGDIYII